MSENFIKQRKQALRAEAMAQRGSLTNAEAETWGRLIQGKVLRFSAYLRSQAVALYSPIQNEVETVAIRDHALTNGKTVYYPKLVGETALELVQIDSVEDFRRGRLGVLEPIGSQRLFENDQNLMTIVVPGVVFDSLGNRIGRGMGWYDRLLKSVPRNVVTLGLAYEFQTVPEIPVDEWDERVNYVITERRIIDCTKSQSSLAS
jgi:5-formyltetrahydrofolate cyclo-ligase